MMVYCVPIRQIGKRVYLVPAVSRRWIAAGQAVQDDEPPHFHTRLHRSEKIHKHSCINVYITSIKKNASSSKTATKYIYT
jgi:hypothetical protein